MTTKKPARQHRVRLSALGVRMFENLPKLLDVLFAVQRLNVAASLGK